MQHASPTEQYSAGVSQQMNSSGRRQNPWQKSYPGGQGAGAEDVEVSVVEVEVTGHELSWLGQAFGGGGGGVAALLHMSKLSWQMFLAAIQAIPAAASPRSSTATPSGGISAVEPAT